MINKNCRIIISIAVVYIFNPATINGEVFTSITHMKDLLEHEGYLITHLNGFILKEHVKLNDLTEYII